MAAPECGARSSPRAFASTGAFLTLGSAAMHSTATEPRRVLATSTNFRPRRAAVFAIDHTPRRIPEQ